MKKLIISIIVTFIVALFITPLMTKNQTSDWAILLDNINPIVPESYVYVKTAEPNESINKDATYISQSYNEKGKGRTIAYKSFGKTLATDRYLKVFTKGQNVQNWEEIPADKVPEKALNKLK